MGARLIAVRHGKPLSEGYADETLRPLSDEGRFVQERVCRRMQEEGVAIDRIYTSPLLRARQTAEVLAAVFGKEVIEEKALGYAFNEEVLLGLIQEGKTVVFVGHEPTLAQFVNRLVGEEVLPGGLSKSAAAVIDFSGKIREKGAELSALYNP